MKHFLLPLVALLGLVLAIGVAIAVTSSPLGQGPVYTVAELQAHLAHDPKAWLGQTVQVQGIPVISGCFKWPPPWSGSCQDLQQGIADPAAMVAPLLLVGTPAKPIVALVRRVPLLGALAPARQVLQWGTPATYRVRLGPAPATVCAAPPCYAALLLDAAP